MSKSNSVTHHVHVSFASLLIIQLVTVCLKVFGPLAEVSWGYILTPLALMWGEVTACSLIERGQDQEELDGFRKRNTRSDPL